MWLAHLAFEVYKLCKIELTEGQLSGEKISKIVHLNIKPDWISCSTCTGLSDLRIKTHSEDFRKP